jgi:hypothetical protein
MMSDKHNVPANYQDSPYSPLKEHHRPPGWMSLSHFDNCHLFTKADYVNSKYPARQFKKTLALRSNQQKPGNGD